VANSLWGCFDFREHMPLAPDAPHAALLSTVQHISSNMSCQEMANTMWALTHRRVDNPPVLPANIHTWLLKLLTLRWGRKP
jgi:hypothetical protein